MGVGRLVAGGRGWLPVEVGKQHRVVVDRDRAWIGNSAIVASGSSGPACLAAGAWSSNCLSLFPPGGAPSLILSPSL
jgi:hypothetical protein